MTAVLTGSGAAFWACVAVASIYGAVCAVRVWRGASRKPPVPGPVTPDATPRPSPVPRAPAPGPIDASLLGRCVATANFYDSGATVVYDHRHRTRTVNMPSIGDEDIEDFLTGEAAP